MLSPLWSRYLSERTIARAQGLSHLWNPRDRFLLSPRKGLSEFGYGDLFPLLFACFPHTSPEEMWVVSGREKVQRIKIDQVEWGGN